MLNFSLIGLFSLLLVSQNILLLNEEILILICFIIFCWAVFNRLNESISLDFINRSNIVKDSIISSIEQLINILNKNIILHKKYSILSTDFLALKNHFSNLSLSISNELCQYSIQKSQTVYRKKLLFTQRLEQQTVKLLSLLLSKKLSKIVIVRSFLTQKLEVPTFLCFHKISLREYLEIV
uniref:ATP synthase B chain n=1 Tax=Sebdenia flabellata TaxID=42024 RepID=A0A0E3DBU0_9FLOR|nr:hypothetical protein Sflab.mt.07 [Sebdenia flabellata]